MIGNASCTHCGSAKREKVGTFSLSFLTVTLNFYDIIAAPNLYTLIKTEAWVCLFQSLEMECAKQKF